MYRMVMLTYIVIFELVAFAKNDTEILFFPPYKQPLHFKFALIFSVGLTTNVALIQSSYMLKI